MTFRTKLLLVTSLSIAGAVALVAVLISFDRVVGLRKGAWGKELRARDTRVDHDKEKGHGAHDPAEERRPH